jgi:predicted small secreted protein
MMKQISMSVMLLAAAVLAGCDSSPGDGVGPAQRAGKAVDEAGAKVTSAVQDQVVKADAAAERAREKAKDAAALASRNLDRATAEVGKKVEKAGEKLQEAGR